MFGYLLNSGSIRAVVGEKNIKDVVFFINHTDFFICHYLPPSMLRFLYPHQGPRACNAPDELIHGSHIRLIAEIDPTQTFQEDRQCGFSWSIAQNHRNNRTCSSDKLA